MVSFGGIEFKNIIIFQTQLMMGTHYTKLSEARKIFEDEHNADKACELLVQVCLRLAWNDAFRHVTKNQDYYEQIIKDSKHKTFDEYVYNEILSNDIVVNTFKEYIKAKNTENKVKVLLNANQNSELARVFETIKIINSNQTDKVLCFGHFQKLYNMAVKYYICLYMLRGKEILDLEFMVHSSYANPDYFKYADCPIDNYILKSLDKIDSVNNIKYIDSLNNECKSNFKKFEKIVWSQLNDEEGTQIYIFLQKTIRKFLEHDENTKNKSNLYFDFANWK